MGLVKKANLLRSSETRSLSAWEGGGLNFFTKCVQRSLTWLNAMKFRAYTFSFNTLSDEIYYFGE